MSVVLAEVRRRRSFAIISHPDAGKTTLTEKFLLYAGALAEAGAVKARRGRRSATSDWMGLERQRGISISSTVLQFTYRDTVLNLLDTPGHQDFSEDTYRVLTAVDSAVMVLDAAKGIEPQTLKLFEVCARRGIPMLTFINKWDRPGMQPLALLDEIEQALSVRATPITWPVGADVNFRGVVDRERDRYVRFERTPRGATEAIESHLDPKRHIPPSDPASEELAMLDALGADHDRVSYLRGESTSVFFGSALWNFGVRMVLDAVIDMAPPPSSRLDADDRERVLDDPFSGFVFKIQANMDPAHRDRIAFVRICSGVFDRGMPLVHGPTGRKLTTRHAHVLFGQERSTAERAYPGDVVGLVVTGGLQIGDTLYVGEPVRFPAIPSFTPERFARIRSRDTTRYKQFRRGLRQLEEEGVVQVLREPGLGDQAPVLAVCGTLQFDVAAYRLEHEFGASVIVDPLPHTFIRGTDAASAKLLATEPTVEILERSNGELVALFENRYRLERLERTGSGVVLEALGAG